MFYWSLLVAYNVSILSYIATHFHALLWTLISVFESFPSFLYVYKNQKLFVNEDTENRVKIWVDREKMLTLPLLALLQQFENLAVSAFIPNLISFSK